MFDFFFFFLGSTYLQFVYNIKLPPKKKNTLEYCRYPVTNVQQLGRTGDHREREKARERARDSCLLPLGKQHRSARVWRIDLRPRKERHPWADSATNSAGELFTRGCKTRQKPNPPRAPTLGSAAPVRSETVMPHFRCALPVGSQTVIPHFR